MQVPEETSLSLQLTGLLDVPEQHTKAIREVETK